MCNSIGTLFSLFFKIMGKTVDRKNEKIVFQLQFKEAVQSLATALNVGYSVEMQCVRH